jgi:peptide/nickel transport system substrate-binding protein
MTRPSKALFDTLRAPSAWERRVTPADSSRVGAVLALVLMSFAGLSEAGGRARAGGTLEAAAVVKTAHGDSLLADTPLEATLSQLTKLPPCKLGELSRPSPRSVRLVIRTSTTAADVVKSLHRVKETPSPYRALLGPMVSASASASNIVEIELESSAPDFEAVLCHPVLAVSPSFFTSTGDRLVAHGDPGLPRAWLDSITIRATDARTAERLVAQRKAQLLLGGDSGEGALLYATFLVAHPRLGQPFAQALESSIDRPGLTRFFVRPPAKPLSTLIPPASEGGKKESLAAVVWPTPSRPAPLATAIELTLVYDAALDEHRAVAERLQVKLGPLGYRLKLEAMPRRQLRERLVTNPDLALVGVLMPPLPLPSLAIVMSLAHEPSRLLDLEALPELARTEAVAERASKPIPNVFPLFVQGLGVTAARVVKHLNRDAYGLPRIDDVFLAAE